MRAAENEQEREHRQREAAIEARSRSLERAWAKPTRKALKAWAAQVGLPCPNPSMTVRNTAADGNGQWHLQMRWQAEGLEFRATHYANNLGYAITGGGRLIPDGGPWLAFEMQDPNSPGSWRPANTKTEIGQILKGAAQAEKDRSYETYD